MKALTLLLILAGIGLSYEKPDTVWTKVHGTGFEYPVPHVRDMIETQDRCILLVKYDYIEKRDSLGNLIWSIPTRVNDPKATILHDNTYIIIDGQGRFQYINDSGIEIDYKDNFNTLVQDAIRDSSGIILLTQIRRPSEVFCRIIKTNFSRDIIWTKDYKDIDSLYSFDIAGTENGFVFSQGIDSSVIITRCDSSGNIIWRNQYQCKTGMSMFKLKYNNGELFWGGMRWAENFQKGYPQLWKVDTSYGNIIWKREYIGDSLSGCYFIKNCDDIINSNTLLKLNTDGNLIWSWKPPIPMGTVASMKMTNGKIILARQITEEEKFILMAVEIKQYTVTIRSLNTCNVQEKNETGVFDLTGRKIQDIQSKGMYLQKKQKKIISDSYHALSATP